MLLLVNHENTVYLVLMEHLFYVGNLHFRRHHLRRLRHDVGNGELEESVLRALHRTAYVAVGDETHHLAVNHRHTQSQSAVAHMYNGLAELRLRVYYRQVVGTHHVLSPGEQSSAERTAWMELCEIGSLEVALCTLMARGAIISMFVVIFILPSLFVLCDKLIINTSFGFKPKKNLDM